MFLNNYFFYLLALSLVLKKIIILRYLNKYTFCHIFYLKLILKTLDRINHVKILHKL